MKKVILLMSMFCTFTFNLFAQQKAAIQLPHSTISKQIVPQNLSNQRNSGRELIFEEEVAVSKDANVLFEHAKENLAANSTYEVEITVFTGDADLRIYGKGDNFRLIRFSENEQQASENSFYEKGDLLSHERNITIEVFGFSHATCNIKIFKVTPTTNCTTDFWFLYNGDRTSSSNCSMTYTEGHDLSVKVGVENEHEIKEVSLFFRDQAFFDDSFPFEWNNIERNMPPGSYPISMTMADNCGNSFDRHCTIVIERNTCNADFWFLYNGDRTSSSNCSMTYTEGHDLSVKVDVENQHEIKEVSLFFRDQAFFDDSFPFEWNNIERNMSPGSYPISMTMTDNCGNSFDRHCTIVIERNTCNADFWFDYNGDRTSSSDCRMTYTEGHDLSVKVGVENQHEIKEVSLFFRDQAFFDDSFPFEWNNIERNMSPGSYPISMTMTDNCGNSFDRHCTIVIERKNCVIDCWFDYQGDRTTNAQCEMTYDEGHNLSVKIGTDNPNEIKEVSLFFRDQAFFDDSFPFEWNEIEKNMSPGTYPISMTITDKCDNTIQKTCTIVIKRKTCVVDCWFDYQGDRTPNTQCEMVYEEGHNLSVKLGTDNPNEIKEVLMIFRDQAFFDDSFPFEWDEIEKNMSPGTYPISMTITDKCDNIIRKTCTIVIIEKTPSCINTFPEGHNLTIRAGVTHEDDIKEIALIFRDQVFFDDSFPFEWIDVEKNMSVGSYPIKMLLTDNCGNIIQKECTIIIEPRVCETDFWFEYKGDRTSRTDCEMIYDQGHNLAIRAGVENQEDIKEVSLFFRDQAFFDDTFPFEWDEIENNMSVGNYPIRMLLTDNCGNTFERTCTIIIQTKVCVTDLWFDFSENSTDDGDLFPNEENNSSNKIAKESVMLDNVQSNVEKQQLSVKAARTATKEALVTDKLALIQNTPNPFEGNTSFRFYNPINSEVALSVFDMSGKQLVQQKAFYIKGWHEVSIDAGQLEGAGVYIYEMNNGEAVVRKKMMTIE